jgi:LysM repeat protein
MPQSFDQYLAESGQQSRLDQLRASGGYEAAKSSWEGGGTTSTPSTASSGGGGKTTYTVKAGDTLSKIAAQYGINYNQITGYRSGNPNLIYPGEVLTIPVAGGGQTTPQSQDQVTPFLNNFQTQEFNNLNAPETKIPTAEELKTQLLPEGGYPTPLNRVEEFEKMRTTYGVADLEKSLTTLKDQILAEQNAVRAQRGIEEGKTVPMGVISGRISEEERVANIRLDELGRQQSRITDELNTKYNLISTYMNFMGLDYQDAVNKYQTEFETNLKIYDLIAGARKEARSIYESDRDSARANLQIYMNALTKGNVDYNSLPADQKLLVNKLEIQAGLPTGFMSSIRKDKDADILFTTSNEGITQVGIRNADGTISVQSYGTRISSAASDTKNTREQFNSASVKSNFPDLVNQFANSMSLEEIYNAYGNTDKGKTYGKPTESSLEISLLYKVARGEMTPDEARAKLGE